MTLQKAYFDAKAELEKQMKNLQYDTLEARAKEIILRGQEVDRLEGTPVSRIPHRHLLNLMAGNKVDVGGSNADNFVKYCRENDIPIIFDYKSGGDEYDGHWSYPTNISLKAR